MLLTSGHEYGHSDRPIDTSEVLDLANPVANCMDLLDAPSVTGSTGGILNGSTPVICGGYEDDGPDMVSGCYRLGDDLANPLLTLSEKKAGAASILMDDGSIWITGGATEQQPKSDTTEYVIANETRPGPTIPEPVVDHCVCQYDDTSAIIIGTGADFKSSWIYDFDTGSWSAGPKTLEGRQGTACGLIKDLVTDAAIIVVVGNAAHSTTTEYYFFSRVAAGNVDFHLRDYLAPFGFFSHDGVVTEGGTAFYVLAGLALDYDTSQTGPNMQLNKLTCSNEACTWFQLTQAINEARTHAVVMLVPDSLVNCS